MKGNAVISIDTRLSLQIILIISFEKEYTTFRDVAFSPGLWMLRNKIIR